MAASKDALSATRHAQDGQTHAQDHESVRRVLFLFGTEPDGTLVRKMRALQRCGYDVHLLYLHRMRSPLCYPFACPTDPAHTNKIDVPDPRGNLFVRAWVMLTSLYRYVALLRRIRPDVVHAVGFDMYF